MHFILAVDFEYMIRNKKIPLSSLHGNTGDLQKSDGYMGSQGKSEIALNPAKARLPGSAV